MNRKILYLCFFLSGMAGLIYEILWSKYLSLFLGSTGIAIVMVLSTYMGGLALGSAYFGRKADTLKSPLLGYVLLELAIGLYGGIYPSIYNPVRSLFLTITQLFSLNTTGIFLGKLLACILSLLIPTFLMGGTLPLLAKELISQLHLMEKKVAFLYFLNSLGAVFGILFSGFYLIANFGLGASLSIASALNIIVAILAYWVFKRKSSITQEELHELPKQPQPVTYDYPISIQKWALIIITLSGLVAMMYEVAWIRILTLILGSSTYSFSLMLLTFILGISVGSYLLSLNNRSMNHYLLLGFCELGIGIYVLLFMPFVWRLPYWFNHISSSLQRTDSTFGLYQFIQFMICLTVMFIPTLLMGITLPAATKVVSRKLSVVGRKLGDVYAFNTLGNVAGSILAGLILLPLIGLKRTLELSFLLNILFGIIILHTDTFPIQKSKKLKWCISIVITILLGGYLLTTSNWDQRIISAGTYRVKDRYPSYQRYIQQFNSRIVQFYRDGIDASIAIIDMPGTPIERALVINGKVDASSVGDAPTESGLAHIPLMLHRKAKNILIIGFGSGITAGTALQYPFVEHIDIVEISRDVIEAGTYFSEYNHNVLKDSRVRVYVEDAKTFLQMTPQKYDVIISEPTNPWIAGIAGLFSKEYFDEVNKHLQPGGIFLQWLHGYEIDNSSIISILHTFEESFPYYTIWNMIGLDLAMAGSTEPYKSDFNEMTKRMNYPTINREFEKIGITTLSSFLYTQIYNKSDIPGKRFDFGPINSDFFPYLEYAAPLGFYLKEKASMLELLDQRLHPDLNHPLWYRLYKPDNIPSSDDYQVFYKKYILTGNTSDMIIPWVGQWYKDYPEDTNAILAYIRLQKSGLESQKSLIESKLLPFNQNRDILRYYADILFKIYYSLNLQPVELRKTRALELQTILRKLIEINPVDSPGYLYELGEIEFSLKNYSKARELFIDSLNRLDTNQRTSYPALTENLFKKLCRIALMEQDVKNAQVYYQYLQQYTGDTQETLLLKSEVQSLMDHVNQPVN